MKKVAKRRLVNDTVLPVVILVSMEGPADGFSLCCQISAKQRLPQKNLVIERYWLE
jgi:hypothetical protein